MQSLSCRCEILVVAFLLFVLSGSCRSVHGRSELSHEIGRPILDGNPLQWLNISDAEYQSVLMYGYQEEFGLRGPGIVGVEHPARRLLQSHMDRLDAMIRQQYPKESAGVPKPVAQLILTSENNAVVYPISLCLDRTGTLPALQGKGVSRFWEFSRYSGKFVVDKSPERPMLCVKRPFTDAQAQNLFTWNLQASSGCSALLKGNSFQLEDDCRLLFPEDNVIPAKADNLVVMSVPNQVTFYAGIFADTSEENVIFWIAHELGHYYRAHGVIPKGDFDIYYRLSNRNPGQRPVQGSDLASFASHMRVLLEVMGDDGLSALNAAQKKEWKQLNLQAYQEKIGQYTKEQEADELGMEWVLDYGFGIDLPVQALLGDLRKLGLSGSRNPNPSEEWNYARCQAAFAADWKDAEEVPVFVPVGDYFDEHHSICYRAFNLYREIPTHGYSVSPAQRKPELLSAAAWKNLQSSLARDVAKVLN